MKYTTTIVLLTFIVIVAITTTGFSLSPKTETSDYITEQDSIKKISDSLKTEGLLKFKLFKKNAHASYYADKFTGRRTASGKIFNNNAYTAAHRKLPFGTKVRVTNENNNQAVIVEITDRGPFTKGRDIDLTKKAFMEIARGRGYGSMKVTIEIVEN